MNETKPNDLGKGLGIIAIIVGLIYLGIAVSGWITYRNLSSKLDRKVTYTCVFSSPVPTSVLTISATPTPMAFKQATVSGKVK